MWENEKYILLEGWAKDYCTENAWQEFTNTLEYDSPQEEFHRVLSSHTVENYIEKQKAEILDYAKQLDSTISRMEYCGSLMNKAQGLDWHNDYYPELNLPVRGILYANPTKVFGTKISDVERSSNWTEIAGSPGDLFLFKTSPTSYHSAGFYDNKTNRLTYNFCFYTV